jgi:methionyl-tRNA formyltransferase
MKTLFMGKSHTFSLTPLSSLLQHCQIVGIVESGPRQAATSIRSQVLRVASRIKAEFFGRDSLRRLASQLSVPYMYLMQHDMARLALFVKGVRPDIICVASLAQILPRSVLDIPRFGAVNLHPSLLPKYHGPFPWFWQYHDFQTEIGATIHRLDEQQDSGAIIKQEPIPLAVGTDIQDAIAKVAPVGARLMVEALAGIEDGTASSTPQPAHDYPKARRVRRDERLVDWENWPLERVWHFLRGTYPWLDPVEYPKHLRGRCRVGPLVREQCSTPAGLVGEDEDGYYVSHREGKIRLLERDRDSADAE